MASTAPVVEGAWPRVATVTDPRPNQAMADLSPQGTAPEHLRARVVEKETQSFSPFASNDDAPGNLPAAAPAAAAPVAGAFAGSLPSSDLPPPAPLKIRVNEIVTHLPAVIAQTVIAPREGESPARIAASAPDLSAPPQEKRADPVRILKFQVEPAALGAITVRMRVSQSRVDIELDAESARTSALLMDAQDHLTSAIGEKGMTLDSFKVSLNPSPAFTTGQEAAGRDDRPASHAGERGFAHEERPEQRQRDDAPPRSRQGRDEKPAAIGSSGVVL